MELFSNIFILWELFSQNSGKIDKDIENRVRGIVSLFPHFAHRNTDTVTCHRNVEVEEELENNIKITTKSISNTRWIQITNRRRFCRLILFVTL